MGEAQGLGNADGRVEQSTWGGSCAQPGREDEEEGEDMTTGSRGHPGAPQGGGGPGGLRAVMPSRERSPLWGKSRPRRAHHRGWTVASLHRRQWPCWPPPSS